MIKATVDLHGFGARGNNAEIMAQQIFDEFGDDLRKSVIVVPCESQPLKEDMFAEPFVRVFADSPETASKIKKAIGRVNFKLSVQVVSADSEFYSASD
ncbi:MAG: hypothetical protein WC242_00255 [Candidatus Paceibacterota bacterium]|jgi:hypothetical protein